MLSYDAYMYMYNDEQSTAWHCNELLYVRIHDANGDNKLDGLELLSAISHGLDGEHDKIDEMDLTAEKKEWKRKVLKNKAWSKNTKNMDPRSFIVSSTCINILDCSCGGPHSS